MATKQRSRTSATAEVLGDVVGGNPGLPLPEPDGNPGLPDLEEEGLDAYEDDVDEETESAVSFTEKDQKDLPLLEKRVVGKLREAAEALREIRQRQLWRLLLNEQGNQLFANFDEYCNERLGHTRQWVTHLTNWLSIAEELERLDLGQIHLTVKAAQALTNERLGEAGGLRAVLEEAKQDSVPLDQTHLREIVLRRANYNFYSKDGREGITKPAAQTYDEYKHDLAVVKQLGESGSYSLIDEAIKAAGNESSQGTGLADVLVSLCQEQEKLPDRDGLLANFTGTALEELVERLMEVAEEINSIKEKKILLAERKKEIKSLLQEGGIKKLKDDAKALETQLVAVGAIKQRGKKEEPPPQEDDGRDIPFPVQEEDDDEAGESENDESEVHSCLLGAMDSLDLALASEWPDNLGALNTILRTTEECEEKLAEINAKAKELLADVEEPQTLPSGQK